MSWLTCELQIVTFAVRSQDDFRMGIALCEFDNCKTDKMRVGLHLAPILEILMDNLSSNFYILCIKEFAAGC